MPDKKEYIERGAAYEIIETEGKRIGMTVCNRLNCKELLQHVPAADVVEVVRCKDCSWFIAREEGAGDCDMIFGFTSPVSENGYCYCGKRKDGDNNAAG